VERNGGGGGGGSARGRCHVEGTGGHGRAAALARRTGMCPLRQGRAGPLMSGPEATVPGWRRFDLIQMNLNEV
jgi:hypothetical protein